MAEVTKVMRYQIVKPTDCEWELLGAVLRLIQRETREVLNKTIQLCWEYQGFSSDYKEVHGDYPRIKEILSYTSLHGYCYDVLKRRYNTLYSSNFSQTIKRATDKWKSDVKDILSGAKSIPSFKRNVPIDVVKDAITVYKEDHKYLASLNLISSKYKKEIQRTNSSFNVLLRVGDNTQRVILDRILSGEYTVSASQILYDNKKWFLNLTYQFEKEKIILDPENIMGIDLGIVHPIYMAFNNSLNRYYIKGGEIEEFRKRTEHRRRELLMQGKYCADGRKGHGYKTRVEPIEKLSKRIEHFRDTCNHKYSRFVIDMAVKHGCGTIQLENLEGISKNSVFLKNWSYYDLQQMIQYKANEKGIRVVFVDPSYTSQRCSQCGHIEEENRVEQATFRCLNCGYEVNADYNAAKNIATKDIEKIIHETLNR
jgi:putative transposase